MAELVVKAAGSASAPLQVRGVLHPDLAHVIFTGGGRYAGVWILDAHGTVLGSALRLTGAGHRPYMSSPDALWAGSYTVYVVGSRPVVAHIPLRRGEPGQTVTATRRTTASYTETHRAIPPTESEATLRWPVPSGPAAVGFAGGFIDAPPRAMVEVDVCLTLRDASCRYHVDPEYSQSSRLGDAGYWGSSFGLPARTVAEGRDVLVSAKARSTGTTAMTAWVFTVALT